MLILLDVLFPTVALLTLLVVVLKRGVYGASHKMVASIIFCEIAFMSYYSMTHHFATPYKMLALVQILSLTAMFASTGGGAWKILIMSLYLVTQSASFICYNYFNGVKFPYLDIINAVGYAQLFILIYSPKTESKAWYERISNSLTGLPILGDYFGRFILFNFNGTPRPAKARSE